MNRLCRSCKQDKPIDEFYKDPRVKVDGRRARCVSCVTNGRPPGPIAMNPLTRHTVSESGCHIWSGSIHKSGYGSIKWKGKATVAHRVVYSLVKGEIGEGIVIDHLCHTKLCVNPDHLEAVSPSVNTQRAWNRRHCATCSCAKTITPQSD